MIKEDEDKPGAEVEDDVADTMIGLLQKRIAVIDDEYDTLITALTTCETGVVTAAGNTFTASACWAGLSEQERHIVKAFVETFLALVCS